VIDRVNFGRKGKAKKETGVGWWSGDGIASENRLGRRTPWRR